MSRLTKTAAYTNLVQDIAELYHRARQTLVESYWQIGRRIVEQEQQGDGKAEYGAQLLEHLSEDLQQQLGSGFSISNLRNMRRFYLNHRIRQPAGELNFEPARQQGGQANRKTGEQGAGDQDSRESGGKEPWNTESLDPARDKHQTRNSRGYKLGGEKEGLQAENSQPLTLE